MTPRSDALRLVALPLTKPLHKAAHGSSKDSMLYLHTILPPSSGQKSATAINKVTNWAGSQWDKLGQAPVKNWKHRVFVRGNQLLDNIEFEEWSLKGLDKDLGPELWPLKTEGSRSQDTSVAQQEEDPKRQGVVQLLYPPQHLDQVKLRHDLQQFLAQREPFHRKWLYRNLLLSPVTWLFAIVPVVPNFPLFWLLWRAWSHWRAATSSRYLLDLFARDQIHMQPSQVLDQALEPDASPTQLLLSKKKADLLIKQLGMDEQARVDFERAIVQAEARLRQMEATTEGTK